MDYIRRKWDIGNKAVEFIPYWENKEVTSATEGSCISYYDKKGEKLVIVSNLSRKNKDLVIKVPKGTKRVINAENSSAIEIKDGKIILPVKRNDFGVLIIK